MNRLFHLPIPPPALWLTMSSAGEGDDQPPRAFPVPRRMWWKTMVFLAKCNPVAQPQGALNNEAINA